MKNIKLFILVISFGLVSSFSFSEEGEEEVVGEGGKEKTYYR